MVLTVAGQGILVVCQAGADLERLRGQLRELGCRVSAAHDAERAAELMGEFCPQLVLLSPSLGQAGGLELCKRLKVQPSTQDVPVVFLVHAGESLDKQEALRAGGLDFLALPCEEAELRARVGTAMRLRMLEDKLRCPAEEDPLTKLLSRTCFADHFSRECNRSRRYDCLFALVLLDVDNFKWINDHYGLSFGDHVLRELADILRQQTRESDYLGRWGGNEFILMLPEADMQRAIGFAKKLLAAVTAHEFRFQDQAVHLAVSIGVASRQNIGGRDPAEMLKLVGGCLGKAKSAGGGRIAYQSCGEFSLAMP